MTSDSPAARLRVALELHEAGIDLMRQNLRRRHPGADEEQIAGLLRAWLRDKPLPANASWATVYTPDEWEQRR